MAGGPAAAADFNVELKPIAQLTMDDDGRRMGYPTSVFYDPTEEEIYVVNGGTGRVVVYGPDFFPRMSIGVGRSVAAPRGGAVMRDGKVYICQGRTAKSSARRITVLNGAFFVDREINLEEIPEAGNLAPNNVAVNREGLIYLASDNGRGVLVLDRDGVVLRQLRPMDISSTYRAEQEAQQQSAGEEEGKEPEQPPSESEDSAEAKGARPEIPEEFRPRSGRQKAEGPDTKGLAPVKINFITIDNAGNLYLLSAETSKIYVYGPDESFLFSFGTKGGSPRQMSQPRGLAIDEELGRIYVADYMRHTILTYDMAGRFLFEFGGRGVAPGWFNFPCGIAVNRYGQVIVADQFNKRVQVLEVNHLGMGLSAGSLDASAPEGTGPAEPTAPEAPFPEQSDGGVEAVPIVEIPEQTEGDGSDGDGAPASSDAADGPETAPGAPAPSDAEAGDDVAPR